jgi:sec-independent protein translocase protein TatB
VFGNLNWGHIAILLVLALFIFGDKLPQAIADGLRLLRNLRRMAQTATSDLSRELGTDIQLEDLHPRTFVRKHILSESDQEALFKPLKSVSEDVMNQARGVESDVKEVGKRMDRTASPRADASSRRRGGSRRGNGRRAATTPEPAAAATPATSAAPAAEPAPAAAPPSYDDIT